MLDIFSRQHNEIFYFSQKTGFDISGKLDTIYMKCQILFSGKNIINLWSAELAQRKVRVEAHHFSYLKYLDTLMSYHRCPKIRISPFDYLVMCLNIHHSLGSLSRLV